MEINSKKIHIFYDFKTEPYGGGNQFLTLLRKIFSSVDIYENNWRAADILFFNSIDYLEKFIQLKRKTPEKIFLLRLDNVMSHYRGAKWRGLDAFLVKTANELADGIIFQSHWSRKEFIKLGFNQSKPHTVIYNNVDNSIFNSEEKTAFNPKMVKLIAASWSDNWLKGFNFYKYLDENLDKNKYSFTFVGRSPVELKNTLMIPPVSSEKLAELLKRHDIFISGVTKDACSNAILEALACRLPIVAYNGCSNPELVKNSGELFSDNKELMEKIEQISHNYAHYQNNITSLDSTVTAQTYMDFANSCHASGKSISFSEYLQFMTILATASVRIRFP